MSILKTTYLGLELEHPVIAGAGPLSGTLDGIRRLEDGGAAAIVMRSLYEEQLRVESLATHESLASTADSFGEATSFLPESADFGVGPDEYMEHLRNAKSAVGVPVIGSLNGAREGAWMDYATLLEEAGADAIELNLYDIVTDPAETAQQVEARTIELVRGVCSRTTLPVAVKLSPFYTAPAAFAAQAPLRPGDRARSRLVPGQRLEHPVDQADELLAHLAGHLSDFLVGQTLLQPGSEIRDARDPEHAHALMCGADDLGDRAHADGVTAERGDHPHLGGRLVGRPEHAGVDALAKREAERVSGCVGQLTESRSVGGGQVGKARAEAVVVGPDERVTSGQIQVVVDHHQIAGRELPIHAASRVGYEQRLRAEMPHDAQRQHDIRNREPLVRVHTPLHRDDRAAVLRADDELPGVPLHRALVKSGDLAVRHLDRVFELVGVGAKP